MKNAKSFACFISVCFMLLGFQVMAAEVDAVLQWSDKTNLGTTVDGKVTAVYVKPGMTVKAGELLVELDQRYFKVKKLQSQSAMEYARLEMEEAQREKARATELFERTVLSEFDRQKADIDLARASAAYAKARADHQHAQLDAEYSQVVAPFDGVILKVLTAPGEIVVNQNESTVLVKMARANEMVADAQVNGDYLSGLAIGQSLDVAFRGQWYAGTISGFSLEPDDANANNRLYTISVVLPVDKASRPRAGEVSAVRLPD